MSTVLLVALILTGGLQTSHLIPVHARESRRWRDTPSLTWRASSFVSNMISLCSLRNNLIEYHSSVVGGWSRAAATAPEEVVAAAPPSSHTDPSEAYGASLPETPSPGTYSEPGPDCAEGGWGVSVTTLSSDDFGSLVEVSPAPAHKSPHDPGAMDEPHKDEKRTVSLVYTPKETCWLSEMAQIASSGSSEMQLELEVEAGLVAKRPASTTSGAVEGTCQDQAGNVMAIQSATMYVTPNGGNEVEIPLLHLEEMTPVEEDRDQANQDIPHHTLRTSRFRLPLKSKFIYPGGLSVLNRIVYTITMGTECSEPLVFVFAVRLQATTPPPEPITPETREEHSAQPEYFSHVRTLFPPAESATVAVTSSTLSGTSILTWEEDPRLEEEDEAGTPTSSRTAVSYHFVTVRHLPEPSGIAHGEPPTVPRSEAQPGEPKLSSFALGPQQLIFEVTGTPNALLQSSTFVLESRFELSSFIEAHTPPKPTIEVSEVSQSESCVAQQLTLCIEFRTSSGTAVLVADNDPIWFAGMQLPKNRNQRKLPNNRSCVVWDTPTRTGPLDNTTRVESDLPSVSHRVKFFQITSDEARIREPLRITIRAWVLARNSPRHPHCRTDAGQIIQWIRPRSWTYKFRVLTRQDGNGWAEDSALDMRTLWMVMNRSGDENRASSDAPLPVATPNEESNQEEGLPKIPTTRPTREQQLHGKFGLWERVMMGVVAVVILLAILGGTSSSMLKAVASLASDTPPHCHEYHREGSPTSPPSIEVPIEGMSKPPQEESEMTFSSVLGTLTNIPTGTYTLSSIDLSMQDEPPMADDSQTWPPSQKEEEKHGTQDALLRPLQGRNQ